MSIAIAWYLVGLITATGLYLDVWVSGRNATDTRDAALAVLIFLAITASGPSVLAYWWWKVGRFDSHAEGGKV